MRSAILAILAILALTTPYTTSAHHSRAEFSDQVEIIEGTIVEIEWRNPHPILTVSVTDESGQSALWRVEGWQSANSLLRKGLTRDVFTTGQTIKAAIQRSNRRSDLALGTSVSLGNGTQAILRPGLEPFFPDEAVIGNDEPVRASVSDTGGTGLFKVWTFRDRTGAGALPLTFAAEQKLAEFDELEDHPMWNCDPVGMPVAMDTGLPVEFVDDGDRILMRIEQNDNTRVFHLEDDGRTREPSVMGHSIGRWEGETLVVTTTGSNYPYFDDDGSPKSADMTIVERFQLDGSDSLTWEATMMDPLYFTEPVSMSARWDFVPGESIESWNCAISR